MAGPTNPYYQRAFNALAGTLARSKQMIQEFALVQRGFDLIGRVRGAKTYQLACSDLETAIEISPPGEPVNYFRFTRPFRMELARISLTVASTSGPVQVMAKLGSQELFSAPLTIPQGSLTSMDATTPPTFLVEDFTDNAEIRLFIVAAGANAKGLQFALDGYITANLPVVTV